MSEHAVDRLPSALRDAVRATLADWASHDNRKVRRLWAGDATLWSGGDEARWLGWLTSVDRQIESLPALEKLAADVRSAGFEAALLLGMGGSSLGPEVLAVTFGRQAGHPALYVLDSTDPAQVASFERTVGYDRTLFLVASKSGSTLEPNVLHAYFFARAVERLGAAEAGRRFIAVTDPGSKLEAEAKAKGFRHIVHGEPSIGGRFSALSPFGTVPAAVMGLDLADFLARARAMTRACAPDFAADQNPGVVLGAILGSAARAGRDKLTIVTSPAIYDLGAWLEQLVAESTGKNGHAIIPVDLEPLAAPAAYGDDRLFAYVRLASEPDAAQDAAVDALEAAGHPVVRLAMPSKADLGAEFFRWEIATAVAGAVMGIHPFDQPDVEASKVATRALTSAYEESGSLPSEAPVFVDGNIALFADPAHAEVVAAAAGSQPTLASWLGAHLATAKRGDYIALLAYLERSESHQRAIADMRRRIFERTKLATCVGFGPRFLHSTGQAYKGGPNSGVFVQLTCDDAADLAVPGQKYTFGIVKAAQARGDFQVLAERGRRALRVHLRGDVEAGLARLAQAVTTALT